MDWFPMQYWRSRCPEVVRVSSATGRTRHEVLGLVCDFWSWVSTESETGTVGGVFVAHLPDLVGGDAAFWAAVAAVNWVAEDGRGLIVPGWDAWLSESAKKRTKDAQRKRLSRAAGPGKIVREVSAKCPKNVRAAADKSVTTGQDRTGQEKKDTPLPPHAGAEFAEAWGQWVAFRREKGQSLKPTTVKLQFALLGKLAEPHAVATLRHSMTHGYTGLFPENARPPPAARDPPKRVYSGDEIKARARLREQGIDPDGPDAPAPGPTP